MPAGNISASSSTEGCSVQSLVWYDAFGSQFSGTFGTQNYTVGLFARVRCACVSE